MRWWRRERRSVAHRIDLGGHPPPLLLRDQPPESIQRARGTHHAWREDLMVGSRLGLGLDAWCDDLMVGSRLGLG